jgi:hypothetical protein
MAPLVEHFSVTGRLEWQLELAICLSARESPKASKG